MSNIELSTDRTLEDNFAEIRELKRSFPDRAVVASLMMPADREAWLRLVRMAEQSGCDGLELNFGCPHGMPERGMGAAIGQVPEIARQVTRWVREATSLPVVVKLTPNVTDVAYVARAVAEGGADGVALINTVASIVGVDLRTFSPLPSVAGRSSHAGYCGPAVKPIALYQVARVACSGAGLPISGIGGIECWRDAAEFILLGATTVQVCTAVMHHGYRIIGDLVEGLADYMDEMGFASVEQMRGRALANLGAWEELDLNYKVVASVQQELCIGCGVCYVACRDGGHQAIAAQRHEGATRVGVDEAKCVGCGLCSLVCPVPGAIRMVQPAGERKPPLTWKELSAARQERG